MSLAFFGLGDATGAFAAHTTADRLALAALVVFVHAAWWAMRSLGDRSARAAFLGAGGLFAGALVARGLTVPFLLLALWLVSRAAIRRSSGWRRSGAFAGFAALLLAVAIAIPAPPRPASADADPAEETRGALAQGNLFEARLWGERWAAETPERPGEPALLLAQINWDLGHRVRARAIAADVSARSSDPELRRRAAERVAQWTEAK